MEERARFLELVEEIKNIARVQGGMLSKEDVQRYLEDMELSGEQMQAVYRYLGANHIKVEGYTEPPSASAEETTKASGRADKNTRLYRKELTALNQQMGDVSDGEVLRFLQGDSALRNRIIESRLEYIMKLSARYKKRNVPREELIAEGNLGLLEGIRVIEANARQYIKADGSADIAAFWGTLELEARQAVESYIDKESGKSEQESAMLAKTNLLHEAIKYLAEENSRMPTVEELSEYTRIPVEEIVQMDTLRKRGTDR